MKKYGCLIEILSFFLKSYLLMLLWNWIVPLFWSKSPILDFWECVGIILLINLIRSSFGLNTK